MEASRRMSMRRPHKVSSLIAHMGAMREELD